MSKINPKHILLPFLFPALLMLAGCSVNNNQIPETEIPLDIPTNQPAPTEALPEDEDVKETETKTDEEEDVGGAILEGNNFFANVVSVEVSGQSNQYYFSVGISSPDIIIHIYCNNFTIINIYRKCLVRFFSSMKFTL